MATKSPEIPPKDVQGSLFTETQVGGGHPDLNSMARIDLEAASEGVFTEPPVEAPVMPRPLVAETVDVRARAAHLLGSLNLLARANRSRGFQAASHEDSPSRMIMEQRYGADEALESARSESMHSKNRLLSVARDQFHAAYEGANSPISKDNPEFVAAWAAFYRRFHGTSNRHVLNKQRKNYQKLIDMEGERKLGEPYLLDDTTQEVMIPQQLTKHEKLNVFAQDSRLQFYPATDKEEEQARRTLNYIDEPHGIHDMLGEIAGFSYKHARKRGESRPHAQHAANVARHSVLHEMSDNLINALTQIEAFTALEEAIAGVSPKLTLAEAVGSDHQQALAGLFRDVVYEEFRAKGKQGLGYNPLSTKEDRRPHDLPGKNKTIEDIFTGSNQPPEIKDALDKWAHTTTVGEAFRSGRLLRSKSRQIERARFWDTVLRKTEGSDKRIATEILESYGLV